MGDKKECRYVYCHKHPDKGNDICNMHLGREADRRKNGVQELPNARCLVCNVDLGIKVGRFCPEHIVVTLHAENAGYEGGRG